MLIYLLSIIYLSSIQIMVNVPYLLDMVIVVATPVVLPLVRSRGLA